MTCQSYRRALLDVALGAPEGPALSAHLGACPACREALERERAHVSRIDLELRSALEVVPSPALVPHARQRAAETVPSPTRPWPWWLVPASVGFVVLVGAILVGRRSSPPPAPPPTAVVQPPLAPPRASAPDVVTVPAPERKAAAAPPSRSARTRPPRPSEPEVLLPAGEAAAFRRFVKDMQDRQVDRISLLAAVLDAPGDVEGIAPAAVEVEPLAIEPLSRSDR